MGLGKTVATLTALDTMYISGDDYPTLIIAPLRVAKSTWPDEIKKWKHLSNITVSSIIGDANERKRALKRSSANIFTINYDNILWLFDQLKGEWPFKRVVADESTKLKSFRLKQGGRRAAVLGKIAHSKVKSWINLTGTPAPNGLADLWGQTWFLDQGQRLGGTFTAFESRWFGYQRDPHNDRNVRRIAFPHAQAEISERLKDICLSIDSADWFDLKKPIISNVYVDLPPKARKHYKEMEKQLFTLIDSNPVEAANGAIKTLKCLQIASGASYVGDKGDWSVLHDEKLDALQSIIDEANGMPVLVAYHFKSDLERLRIRFPYGRVLDTASSTITDWNTSKIPLLFSHPASAGHGLNLQDGGNIIVFFSHWWNLEEYQQIIERIGPVRQLQAGHKRNVFIYHIVARNTVDELVMARRESKRTVQDILLEAAKRARK